MKVARYKVRSDALARAREAFAGGATVAETLGPISLSAVALLRTDAERKKRRE